MYCKKCGSLLDANAKFCSKCGTLTSRSQNPDPDQNYFHCPNCKNDDLVPTMSTISDFRAGKNYSVSKGCLGYLLLGPLGLLCGACGNDSATLNQKNKTYWFCKKCGNKFLDINDLEKEIEDTVINLNREKTWRNLSIIGSIFFLVLDMFPLYISVKVSSIFLTLACITAALLFVYLICTASTDVNNLQKYLKALYEEKEYLLNKAYSTTYHKN